MHTQCAECDTILPVSAAELALAHGQVRCGSCGAVFFALEALCEELDINGYVRTCFHSERPPTLNRPGSGDSLIDDLFLSQPPELPADPIDDEGPPLPLPRRLRPPAPKPRLRTLLWSGAAAVLLIALAAQWGSQQRERLARDPLWRPWLERACAVLSCQVPLAAELDQVRLVGRNIRPHPSVAGALIISAAMQNQAPYPQRWPTVEIALSNLNGRPIAMRRFAPHEYVDGDAGLDSGMPPGTLFPLVFEVVDPGEDAVAFEFAFR